MLCINPVSLIRNLPIQMLKVLVSIWFLIEEPMTNVWSGRLRRDLWICTGQELDAEGSFSLRSPGISCLWILYLWASNYAAAHAV